MSSSYFNTTGTVYDYLQGYGYQQFRNTVGGVIAQSNDWSLFLNTATDSDNNPNTFDAQWLWNSGETDTGKLTFLDTDLLKSGPEEWSATFTSTQTSLLLPDANHDSWPDGFIAKDSRGNDIQVPLIWQAKDSANVVARFSVSAYDEQNHPATLSGVLKDTNNDTLPDQIIGSWGAMSFDFGMNLIDTNSDGKFDQVSIIQTVIRSGLVQVDATGHPAGFYLANSTSGDFTAPIVSTFSPGDDATGTAVGSNIVLSFSEIIGRGTGTIAIHSGSATGSVIESYDATTSTNLAISSNTLTINPTADLASNTQYFITFDQGSITDFGGHSFIGTTSYNFTTSAIVDQPVMTPMTHKGVSVDPDRYIGPATAAGEEAIHFQFIGDATGEIVGGTGFNDFISVGAGVDAVNAGAGNDVIDGGLDSNFLTGGAGTDIFFSDGRGGGITWSTITDWQAGEQLSVWGWKPGVSRIVEWVQAGAEGYKGITMHADLDGNSVIDTSVTFTGITPCTRRRRAPHRGRSRFARG